MLLMLCGDVDANGVDIVRVVFQCAVYDVVGVVIVVIVVFINC